MDINVEIKVSVIMPIYNACTYLRSAVDSILGQTLSEIELICVDDGSTDSSLDIIREYQERDGRVRIITETNAGPALARNNGIRRARGEYLAFVDADDFLEPEFLSSLYELAKRDDLDIAISKYDIYNNRKSRFEKAAEADHSDLFGEGVVTSKNEHPNYILSSTIGSAWNKLFRRSFLVDKQLVFLPEVKMYEDVYFVVTAMSLAERVGKIHKVLMHHRIHSEQARARMFRKYYSQVPEVYLQIKNFLMQRGLYAPLLLSYLNLSASRCYKIFNLLSGDSKENFWDLLNEKYAELLGWQDREESDFESAEVAYFAACVGLYNYNLYKKYVSKGKKAPSNGLAKKRKKARSFLAKLFGKKK